MRVINDLTSIDTMAFLNKVSEVSKASTEAAKAQVKKMFESAHKLSDKKACHSLALLMGWHSLALCFAIELNSLIAETEVTNG